MEPRRFAGHLPGCCRSEWVRFAETPSDQPEFSGVAAHLVGAGGVPHLANPRPTVEQKRDPPTYVESQRFAGPPRGQFFGDGSRFMGGGPVDPPKFTDSTTRMKRAAEFHRRESMADCEDISPPVGGIRWRVAGHPTDRVRSEGRYRKIPPVPRNSGQHASPASSGRGEFRISRAFDRLRMKYAPSESRILHAIRRAATRPLPQRGREFQGRLPRQICRNSAMSPLKRAGVIGLTAPLT